MFGALKATLGAGATRFLIYGLLAALSAAIAVAGLQRIESQAAQLDALTEQNKAKTYKDSLAREQAAFQEYKDSKEAGERALKQDLKNQRSRETKLQEELKKLQQVLDEPDEEYADYYACLNVKRPPAVLRLLNYSGNRYDDKSGSSGPAKRAD